MKNASRSLLILTLAALLVTVPSAFAQEAGVPPLVRQLNNGNWLPRGYLVCSKDRVADAAFIQTVPNRNFIDALPLHGTGVEFFGRAWKPDDLVKVK